MGLARAALRVRLRLRRRRSWHVVTAATAIPARAAARHASVAAAARHARVATTAISRHAAVAVAAARYEPTEPRWAVAAVCRRCARSPTRPNL